MRFLDALIFGLTLGGTYALVALGLNLQYGVARILNLAYGEMLIAAAFAALVLFTSAGLSPLLSAALILPVAMALGALLYRVAFVPLVRRAPSRDALDGDTILSTFGWLFVMQGVMLALFGGNYMSYSYLATPVQIGPTVIAANRLLAMGVALALGAALFGLLKATRMGTALRGVAANPETAPLVGIDVRRFGMAAFALGTGLVAVAGVLTSMFSTFSATMGVLFSMKALIVVIMGGVGNFAGCIAAALLLGVSESIVSTYIDPGLTLAANYAIFLLVLVFKPAGLFGKGGTPMTRPWLFAFASAAVLAVLAFVPRLVSDYGVSLMINLLMYAILATAWGIFCGTTRLISLATVAFFGVGCYTVAVLSELLPWPLVLLAAGAVGALLALLIGLCTLRLSGMYFVIFSFGVAELIRQLVTWYEARVAGSVGRYVFLDIDATQIYWQLLALLAIVWGLGIWLTRSRLGFALRLIGEDETAARSCGIDTVAVRLVVLVASAAVMAVTGAIVAPRWTYIEPAIAFNSVVSFQVVIMALLGGIVAFYGPLLGVVPLVLAFEVLNKYFPDHFSIVVGVIFLLIVYVLPGGLLGVGRRLLGARRP